MRAATAEAPANIAFVKYWGNRDPELRLPLNSSLSMALSAATTRTTVAFVGHQETDVLILNGQPAAPAALQRVKRQLDWVREQAGLQQPALVVSENRFPTGAGIASSASGFAALALASSAAAGLDLDERTLTVLARRGSGSAARSIPGGFVEWLAADRDADSYARCIAPAEHWPLCDVVAIVSQKHKAVGSTDGHQAALASPYLAARLAEVEARLSRVRRAILERDLPALGPELEAEAISLHFVAMTGQPPLLYWRPATVALLLQVRAWREAGLPVYFTLDAGPNVHLICEAQDAPQVARLLGELPYVTSLLVNDPAGPARLADEPDLALLQRVLAEK